MHWGRPLRWETDHTHTVSVQVPSLYERAPTGWWRTLTSRQAFRERTAVAVWFSGGRALARVVAPWPGNREAGGAVGKDFSGEVRKIASRRFRADEIEAGGWAAPEAKRGGVLRMHVVLPEHLHEEGEPLFAGGAHFRSSIVFVQGTGDGRAVFVYENYGGATVKSEPVLPGRNGNVVEIELPTFRRAAYGVEHTDDVVIRVDGREILRTRQVSYPFDWGNEALGWNPFGTTCAAVFRGWLLDITWNTAGN